MDVKQTNIRSHKGWLRDVAIREYPYFSTREIATKYGVRHSSVQYWVGKLKLQHTDETRVRISQRASEQLRRFNSGHPEITRKRSASMRHTAMMERFRVMSGLPQKTKMRIAVRPMKVHKTIWYLVNSRNYFRDIEVGGRFTLYYDEETRRSDREEHYTKSLGLTFKKV